MNKPTMSTISKVFTNITSLSDAELNLAFLSSSSIEWNVEINMKIAENLIENWEILH